MGIFDDLIPDSAEPVRAKPTADAAGIFDDLIPAASSADGMFDDLIPAGGAESRTSTHVDGPDETDDARAERGFGRSAYLDDGAQNITSPSPRRRASEPDPFEGEGIGPLAARRGQQFARGATEVIASVPEATAIAGEVADTREAEGASKFKEERAATIRGMEARLEGNIDPDTRNFIQQRLAELKAGQAELQSRADAEVVPAMDRPVFAKGDEIRRSSEDLFGAPDPRDQSFWGQVAEGGGNMTALAATAFLGPGGVAVGAGLGAGMNTSSLYKEAIDAGASSEDARIAAKWGAAFGASEIIPINRALKLLPPRLRQKAGGALYKRVSDIAQGAGEEAAQEYLATVANNIIAQNIYDPDRGWTEGATEAALVGAVLGGALGGAGSARYSSEDDPDRANSPRLTESDRASPIPNAIIDDGKAAIEAIASSQPTERPLDRAPLPSIAPMDESSASVGIPRIASPSSIAKILPEAGQPPMVGDALKRVQPQIGGGPTANISDPIPEVDENGQDTGRMVRIDMETGRIVEDSEGPQEIAEAAARTVPPPYYGQEQSARAPDGLFSDLLPDAPNYGIAITATPTIEVNAPSAPDPNRVPTVQKRPLAHRMKEVGVKPGSPLAKELNARDITARTHPGLFKANGATDWDNLPVQEYQDLAASIPDDGNGYLSQDGIIDAMANETRGELLPVGEQAELRAARDAKEAQARLDESGVEPAEIDIAEFEGASYVIPQRDQDISTDGERYESIRRSVDATLDAINAPEILEQSDYIEIYDSLSDTGGNVEAAIWAQVDRSVERAERTEQSERIARRGAVNRGRAEGEGERSQPESGGSDPQPAVNAGPAEAGQQGDEVGERTGERAAQIGAPSSWIIREMATGKAVIETRDQAKVKALNTQKYEAVPAVQHLQELNDPTSKAYSAARSDFAPITTERTDVGEQQVIPGAEQSAERSTEARQSGQATEVAARSQQSKMRTSTPQQDAGGLFDAQDSMFADLTPAKSVKLTDISNADTDSSEVKTAVIADIDHPKAGGVDVPTTAERIDQDAVARLLPQLRERLDKAMLKGVALEIAPEVTDYQSAIEGDAGGNLKILVGATLDAEKSIDHEAVHALRAMNLFKQNEWAALSGRAQKVWLKQFDITARYPDLDAEGKIEEAIAEAYANRAVSKSGPVATAFARVRRFFKAMGEALRGSEITSTDDLFQQVETGAVGARAADSDTLNSAIDLRKEQRPPLSPDGRSALAASTKTAHIPDRTIWQEAADRNVNLLRPKTGIRGAIDGRVDRFRELIQDRMLILRRAEEAIAANTGDEITKAESAYYAEERYSGRVGAQLDALTEQYHVPIARIIARGSKISLADHKGEVRKDADAVGLWLTARHAKERNAYIGEVNEKMTDGGSGLTNAQADAILKAAEGQPFTSDLKTIGTMIDDLGGKMIDTREQAGLLTLEEAKTWRAQYKHYVPLKGFAETDMYDEISNEATVRKGRNFTVQGKESKQAMGRTSEAFDPLSTMLAQAEEVVVRAEKNRVARTLFDLIKKHPSPAIWEIKEPETRRVFNKAAGRVETQIVNPANVQLGPNEMALKVDGVEKRINFVDARLGTALGQVGADQLGRFTQMASYFSRYFSTVNTMLSPPFMIVNGFRDMITAQINAGQFPKSVRGPIRKAMVRDWGRAFAGSYAAQGGGGGKSDFAKHYREYAEVGAKVAFWKVETPDAQNDRLSKLVRLETGNKLVRGVKKNLTLSTDTNPSLGWIERVNLSVDNAIRLASFVEARKQGMTVEEAASLSKNLTVNFNRRGTAGPAMNAWYPFANAAIQGSHVLLKAARAAPVRRTMYGAFLIGMANEWLNATLSEEDEDGELVHDKIPDYISSRNLIVSTGGEARATIPLPYGFNVPFYAGQQLAKVLRGVKDADEAMGDIAKTTLGAFSPISGETVTQTLLPTLGDHMFELATNSDWQGRPIRPESAFGDHGPQAYQEWNVPAPFGMAARGLNKLTGGSELESGMIDISPEYMHHTFKFLGGGALRFVDKVTDGVAKKAMGEEVEAHRIPLLRVLKYTPSDWLNQSRYFEFKSDVQEAAAMVKRAKENRMPVPVEMAETAKLEGSMKSAEKQRKNYSKLISDVYAHPTKTDAQKRKAIEPLMERRNDAYVKFNRAFIKAKGPQSE